MKDTNASDRTQKLKDRLEAAMDRLARAVEKPHGQMLGFTGGYAGDLIDYYLKPHLASRGLLRADTGEYESQKRPDVGQCISEIWLSGFDPADLHREFAENGQNIVLLDANLASHEAESTEYCLDMILKATSQSHTVANPQPRDLSVPKSLVFQGVIIGNVNSIAKKYWLRQPEIADSDIDFVSLEAPHEELLFEGNLTQAQWEVCHDYCFAFLEERFAGIVKQAQVEYADVSDKDMHRLFEDLKRTSREYILPQVPTLETLHDLVSLVRRNRGRSSYPEGRKLLAELRIDAFWENEL